MPYDISLSWGKKIYGIGLYSFRVLFGIVDKRFGNKRKLIAGDGMWNNQYAGMRQMIIKKLDS